MIIALYYICLMIIFPEIGIPLETKVTFFNIIFVEAVTELFILIGYKLSR